MFDKEDTYWWFAARRAMVLTLLRKYLKKGSRILDAGCGTGLLTKTIDHVYKVTATDISDVSLRLMRKRKPRAVILKANLEKKLPFPARSFDGITLLDVLEHIDDHKALKNFSRILKPGGIMIITVPAYPWLFSYWDILHQHKRRYTQGSLIKLLNKHGFSVEHSSYFNTVLFPFILFIRVLKSFFDKKHEHSDCYEMPKPANNLLLQIFRRETDLATRYNIPFGLSLLVIAKKRQDKR